MDIRKKYWLVTIILAGLLLAAGCGDDASETAVGGDLDALARPQQGRSMRATSTMRVGELRRGPDGNRDGGERRYDPSADPRGDADVKSNWDNFNVPPGATHVLMDAQGPGVITHIWITFLGPEPQGWATKGSADHQELMLRMYWDGDPRPAVEAPVGDFFANCFGQRAEVVSVPVVVEGADSYNAFWRMPFRKSARIEIENQSAKPLSLLYYNIDWIKLDKLAKDTPYFYAQYRQEYPARKGQDYVLLETQGKGHFVGAVLGVRMRSPAWFGEGDEKIYIDGETKPSIWGTGTEDYFLSAWGLEKTSTPYFGVPFFDYRTIGGHVSSYRWHVHDPIVFNTGIKVTMEHMGWMSEDENPEYKATSWNEREDDYASVAFWYQTGTPTFAERAPGAGERRLPSLAKTIVPGWDPAISRRHGEGDIVKTADEATGEDVLVYRPTRQAGAWLEFPIEVAAKEPLRLEVDARRSPDGGLYQALLDGVKIGRPLNFHAAADAAGTVSPLLDFWPEPGRHVLRLECVGKSGRSMGYACGVASVRLLERRPRVAEYGHDRDKDWRKAPVLYY
ncbi:MAG: hypothetical protein A2W20_04990 [Candidatus Aminicenantes bacterium RBG_16_66_30]|nr:MAG: hypothetical protein A2W20_04990 [Candidatus Aminicenantes bacterium RBG_16_66_30]